MVSAARMEIGTRWFQMQCLRQADYGTLIKWLREFCKSEFRVSLMINRDVFFKRMFLESDFFPPRMMDTGKKRMLAIKKADRDRKKLNETILKRLKTLDAESSGASMM